LLDAADNRMKATILAIAKLLACTWRLRPHLRGGRHLVLAVVTTSVLSAALEGIGVGLLVPLLSLLLGGEGATPMRPIRWVQEWLPGHSAAYYVFVFCALVLGAIVAKNVVLYLSLFLAARLKRRMAVNLRDALFRKIHRAELSLFEHRTAGELSNACFGETARTIAAMDLLLLLGQRMSIGSFYLATLLYISWELTFITLLLTGGIGFAVGFLHRRMARSGAEITEANQRLGTCLLESFAGVRVVRATHSQDTVQGRFTGLNDEQARIEERNARTGGLLMPVAEIAAVTGAMVIIAAAYYFFVRSGVMLSSYLLGFGFILLRLLPLVNQIYGLQGHILFLAPGVQEVERWLASPEFPVRPFGEAEFRAVQRDIVFDRVSYTYPNGTAALREVSFTMPAGRTLALVGKSGSGKSTLATLLLRLRQPASGRITTDGTDYWEFSAESWHRSIGIVEQEAFLFHDTLAQNIAYGREGVTREQVEAAIRVAHLEDVVAELPGGLDTIVGERGSFLSGGQRQRLAIARAIVHNPRLLILDEATSALDNLSEREVQVALEQAMEGRTVLVIAHRLSTIRNADHIVVLEQGRVAEQGSWEELVARGGHFEKLVKLSAIPV
jgi:ATP-binding cassette, subfamily B, bacterial MsbA